LPLIEEIDELRHYCIDQPFWHQQICCELIRLNFSGHLSAARPLVAAINLKSPINVTLKVVQEQMAYFMRNCESLSLFGLPAINRDDRSSVILQ
jgi:hypothetical protein